MSNESAYPDPLIPPPAGPGARVRGWSLAAWIVIVVLILAHVLLPSFVSETPEEASGTAPDDPVGEMLMGLQGRYLVGAGRSGLPGAPPEVLYQQANQFNVGSIGQRQRFVVLAGELAGPDEARRRLAELADDIAEESDAGSDFAPSESQASTMRLLEQLYGPLADDGGDPVPVDPTVLDADEQARLVEGLGWFGRLALTPPGVASVAEREDVLGPAVRTFVLLVGAFVGALIVGGLGFVGLVVLGAFALVGRLRSGLPERSPVHGVYAETFAVWLLLFTGLQVAVGLLVAAWPGGSLMFLLVAFFASLAALAWPVLRGIPWRTVRADLGLTAGRAPLAEPFLGIASYAMGLPLLAVGVFLTLGAMFVQGLFAGEQPTFAPAGGPAHPIVLELAGGDWRVVVQVLLLGSVAAPIIEETMFRGVLYRHLRDASRGLGAAASILASAFFNAFLFAIIHPQGWVAVPALMSLAVAFSLAREWRGTLLPPMIMHGLSNGLVLVLLTTLLRQ